MDDEPLKVQLARIEERQISTDKKIDKYHDDVKDQTKMVHRHETAIARLIRDRKWERSIIVAMYTAMIGWFKHQ
jgi:hypothetical protein